MSNDLSQDSLDKNVEMNDSFEVTKRLGNFSDKEKEQNSQKTVYVGMSGGVDSSVSALLLKKAGYHVVGVYMKNWSRDLPGMKCPWAEDLADAKRVAVKLDIDFKIFDFETEYKQKVVDYMLDEFKRGNTPNPDIMCNQEIKFKLFYDVAREDGADLIATGHYARIGSYNTEASNIETEGDDGDSRNGAVETSVDAKNSSKDKALCRAVDENKDQTYFLYRISQDAINHTLFPVGGMMKPDVKKLAAENGLDNAYKKESMGVCFVGDVGMKDFLMEYLKSSEDKEKYLRPGKIIDGETSKTLGYHDGAIFYTIGQRHGLEIGGGLPYYVVGKDMEKNEVYVSKNLNSGDLWTKSLRIKDVILRDLPQNESGSYPVEVRLRHRAKLEKAVLKNLQPEKNKTLLESIEWGTASAELEFADEVKRVANGQSAVIYSGNVCLGGGVIY